MKDPVVADSTCLIALERIGSLEILPALFEPVLIPPEVDREFGAVHPWLKVETPANAALVDSSVRPLIENLEMHGFYLSAALKSEAIRLAGE